MQDRLNLFSQTSAIIVSMVGVLVLTGWIFDVAILKSIIPGGVTMKVNTALCFIFSGSSLFLLRKEEINSTTKKTVILPGIILTIVISLLSLYEYLFKTDLGIDELFFKDYSVIGNSKPGLMSPVTAINFCLCGIVILLLFFKSAYYKITQLISLLVFSSALLSLIEIIYGVEVFYNISFYTKLSLLTSLAFVLFSISLITSQGQNGIMVIFMSNTSGGSIFRLMAPAAIIIPLVLGWITLHLENNGFYESHFGHALFSISNMIFFMAIILWITRHLMKADIDLKKSEAEKEKRAEELTTANKELGQFVYAASHDLQEPLRTISNFVGLVETKYSGKLDNEGDQYLNFITAATSKMQALIKDLLNLSRLGNEITFAQVDCNIVLKEIIADLDSSIKESKANINIPNLPVLKGNITRLKQLFLNLISNAIKFRKIDVIPEIEITVLEKETEYLFAIKDNGIGIEEQYFNKLFIIFQRLNDENEYPGTGIGLAICKKIVEQHEGKIWVESKLGEGSTFYFTISKKI